jgi:hypothetical protein
MVPHGRMLWVGDKPGLLEQVEKNRVSDKRSTHLWFTTTLIG